LLRDGLTAPDEMTPLKDYHWLDKHGDVRANARITANMTKRIDGDHAARSGTMHIVASWKHQIVQLVACPRHFGGWQWYFLCPRENRRVSVLWSPPGKRFFAGRASWGDQVAYLSQYHQRGARAHYMARKVCDRIGGPGASEVWEIPPKPNGMRWRTYQRLSERCQRYRDKATVLPTVHYLDGDVV
jgi:hypothetical protein